MLGRTGKSNSHIKRSNLIALGSDEVSNRHKTALTIVLVLPKSISTALALQNCPQ